MGSEFPVACYTCGERFGRRYDMFQEALTDIAKAEGPTPADKHDMVVRALHKLRVYKLCCKALFLAYVDDTEDRMAETGALFFADPKDVAGTEGQIAGTVALTTSVTSGRRRVPTVLAAR